MRNYSNLSDHDSVCLYLCNAWRGLQKEYLILLSRLRPIINMMTVGRKRLSNMRSAMKLNNRRRGVCCRRKQRLGA